MQRSSDRLAGLGQLLRERESPGLDRRKSQGSLANEVKKRKGSDGPCRSQDPCLPFRCRMSRHKEVFSRARGLNEEPTFVLIEAEHESI